MKVDSNLKAKFKNANTKIVYDDFIKWYNILLDMSPDELLTYSYNVEQEGISSPIYSETITIEYNTTDESWDILSWDVISNYTEKNV